MAYMRGRYYLWSDTEDWLHIWVADGYDGWDESGWAHDKNGVKREGMAAASGVSLPEDVMDQYVLMRLAELIHSGKIEATLERFLAPEGQRGNFGAALLENNLLQLRQALLAIRLDGMKPG